MWNYAINHGSHGEGKNLHSEKIMCRENKTRFKGQKQAVRSEWTDLGEITAKE